MAEGAVVFAVGSLLQMHSDWFLAQLRGHAASQASPAQGHAPGDASDATAPPYLLPTGEPRGSDEGTDTLHIPNMSLPLARAELASEAIRPWLAGVVKVAKADG